MEDPWKQSASCTKWLQNTGANIESVQIQNCLARKGFSAVQDFTSSAASLISLLRGYSICPSPEGKLPLWETPLLIHWPHLSGQITLLTRINREICPSAMAWGFLFVGAETVHQISLWEGIYDRISNWWRARDAKENYWPPQWRKLVLT